GGNLIRHDYRFEASAAVIEQLLIANQVRKRRDLHQPASAMIVFCVALLHSVLAGCHPLEIIGEPLLDSVQLLSRQSFRSFQYFDSARDFDKMNRVDDADAPSSRDAM